MKTFKAEVRCGFPEWWRYNVFMTAACFDVEGNIADYVTLTDKVYEPGDGSEVRPAPADYDAARPLALEIPPCDRAEVYVYVIAKTFPVSDVISKSPPFDIELLISTDGGKPTVTTYPINQWGGISVKRTLY
jgi:hypothetical protein